MNKQSNSTSSSEEQEQEQEELTFESTISDLAIQIQEYDALSNEDKIQNIDQYNAIVTSISQHEEELNELKTKIQDIETIKPSKKKSLYTKKQFVPDMQRIVEIKKHIEDNEDTISNLLELYNELVTIQHRIQPYLESKKLEIIKL